MKPQDYNFTVQQVHKATGISDDRRSQNMIRNRLRLGLFGPGWYQKGTRTQIWMNEETYRKAVTILNFKNRLIR